MAINGIESICSLSRQNFGVYGKCAVAFPALVFEERVAPRSSVLQQYRLRDFPPSCDIIPIYLNLPMPIPTPLATKILLSLGEEEISIPHFSFDNIIPILYFIDYLDYQLFLDVLKRHFLTNHLPKVAYLFINLFNLYGDESTQSFRQEIFTTIKSQLMITVSPQLLFSPRKFAKFIYSRRRIIARYNLRQCVYCNVNVAPLKRHDFVDDRPFHAMPCCTAPIHQHCLNKFYNVKASCPVCRSPIDRNTGHIDCHLSTWQTEMSRGLVRRRAGLSPRFRHNPLPIIPATIHTRVVSRKAFDALPFLYPPKPPS